MENTYKAKVYCGNCDFREEINIQKGRRVDETECPNCGNSGLCKDQSVVITGNTFNEDYI